MKLFVNHWVCHQNMAQWPNHDMRRGCCKQRQPYYSSMFVQRVICSGWLDSGRHLMPVDSLHTVMRSW